MPCRKTRHFFMTKFKQRPAHALFTHRPYDIQQNKLYPTSKNTPATISIKKHLGKIKAINIPTPIKNSINPKTRFIRKPRFSSYFTICCFSRYDSFTDYSSSAFFASSIISATVSSSNSSSLEPATLSVTLFTRSGTISRILVSTS